MVHGRTAKSEIHNTMCLLYRPEYLLGTTWWLSALDSPFQILPLLLLPRLLLLPSDCWLLLLLLLLLLHLGHTCLI